MTTPGGLTATLRAQRANESTDARNARWVEMRDKGVRASTIAAIYRVPATEVRRVVKALQREGSR